MSTRILEYFNYEQDKSLIHRFDPRTKMLFVIVLTCYTILFKDLVPLMLLFAGVTPLVLLAKFFKKWLRAMITVLPLVLLIIILNALLLKNVPSPTTAGLAMGFRFLILAEVFGIFFQTVSPDELSQMFIKFRFPYSLAWAISTAYRFIPTLTKETAIIVAAQKARGLQIDRGNIFKRLKNMIPLLIPIFASAFRRSWQLAEAIESRGWNAMKKRTFLYSLRLKWWDYLTLLLLFGLFALFLFQVIKQYPLPSWMLWQLPEKYELKNLAIAFWSWLKNLFQK
ncbi:MAG: energy-coupling factor transporter transmembrane component T family protein [Candidatus Heimdallarchaeota archaeon]